MRRTQIYLQTDQAAALARRARRSGVTSSHLIREAIDEYLAQPESASEQELARFRSAVDGSFGVAPDLLEGSAYVDRVRRADTPRFESLEVRRRR